MEMSERAFDNTGLPTGARVRKDGSVHRCCGHAPIALRTGQSKQSRDKLMT